MEPKIIQKEAFLVAGISGAGDETARTWEAFTKIEEMHPLPNRIGEEGYEIRLDQAGGPGKIHVGVAVYSPDIPLEYKIFYVPTATYAEFEIYPAKGYQSSNAAMNQWLLENEKTYRQAFIDGKTYAIEVYDKRYKGEKEPASVVGIWIPLIPAAPSDPAVGVTGPLNQFAREVETIAGAAVSNEVMAGKEAILSAKDPASGALWMKQAVDRLDTLAGKGKAAEVMGACGRSCNLVNHQETQDTRKFRLLCKTDEDFLDKFLQSPVAGARFERESKKLIQYYCPQEYGKEKYGHGLRCYCSLIGGLPEGVNASPTYCQCSRAYVQAHWEAVLGRPVKVELGRTALTGSDECKFIIHL
jgi:predicted transcriptional regulator YdeE